MIRRPASLYAVPRCDGVPALHAGRLCLPPRYYQGAATSRRPSRLASFSFAWRCRRCVLPVRSRGPDERPVGGPGLLRFGQPVPSCVPTETAGSPKFLGEPPLHLRRALRPRQDHRRLTGRDAMARPPWRKRRGLLHCSFRGSIPRLWCSLSTLRPGGRPPRDARLASGCWSGSAGRARSAGFQREVPECFYIHPPLPSLLGAIPHSGQVPLAFPARL